MPKSKVSIGDVAGDGVAEVRVIYRFRAVGAEILDLVASLFEVCDDGVFHFESAVIGADGDAEWGLAHRCGDVGALNDGMPLLETGNFGKMRTIHLTPTKFGVGSLRLILSPDL